MSNPTTGVRVYYDRDADASSLAGRTIAILGYGSQGHAHALNLQESGATVIVGLRSGGASWRKAEAAGLDVRSVADAARAADTIMMLVPDQDCRTIYDASVAPALGRGVSGAGALGPAMSKPEQKWSPTAVT